MQCAEDENILKQYKISGRFKNSGELKKTSEDLLFKLRRDGFLLANYDSIISIGDTVKHFLYKGNIFKYAELKRGNAEENVLSAIGFNERMYAGEAFREKEFARLMEKILRYYENHGYPFASCGLDSIKIENGNIKAQLKIEKNKLIRIDSILIVGNANIRKKFIYHHIDIKPGSAYHEDKLRTAGNKLRQLPFLKESKGQLVKISDKGAKLILFLDKKNASQFDGILGILPDNKGKTILTGDLKIKLLNNILKSGELVELQWRRLQSQTQDVKIKLAYPYLFNTPLGADYQLKLYKRDTSFIDVLNQVGLQYIFGGLNHIKVFYKQRDANLLSTTGLQNITRLPDYADIRTSSYGLAIQFEQFDYRFNPRKGIGLLLSGSVGDRVIRKNSKINDAAYNGIKLRSTQYQIEGEATSFIPLFKRMTMRIAAQGGWVESEQLFKNELFRIGGFRSLRGVDEESIFASSYVIPSLELRYLFEQNSAFFIFADGAWYENRLNGNYINDMPFSFGAGINFETKAGIFSLNYALGKQFNNPLDIRTGKIHFGFINTF